MTTQKTISLDLIQSFNPCYNPSNIIDENEILSIKAAYIKYKDKVNPQDIVWILCRKDFLTDTQLKHFALFCAKQAICYIANPDPRITKCIETTEKYLNGSGSASLDQLLKDKKDAADAAYAAAYAAADAAADAADAVKKKVTQEQIDYLINLF